ncbi:MAG: dual specificity protein phosphatase family protein [Nitrososphaerota archaeon]|nr:dual specificity protein phosphatase family protein [Nitrososphaerota archaeon]MDG7013854.1 dual specificity protein phosphatase family protein [Nitrososphaerota archaeon]MDG7025197.1 dual specificity protein phosphatase family protein [Nitrososphaerota archaeon]
MGAGGVFLRRLRAVVADKPTGFVWAEDTSLAGSGYPASREQIGWLVRNGVDSVLTLTEQPLPAAWTAGFPLDMGHVSMRDHLPPTVESMKRAVGFILDRRKEGKTVLVHCLAGEGRTGCVLAAYLIRTRHMGADEAIAALRSLKPEFVERRQESSVREFEAAERSATGPTKTAAPP